MADRNKLTALCHYSFNVWNFYTQTSKYCYHEHILPPPPGCREREPMSRPFLWTSCDLTLDKMWKRSQQRETQIFDLCPESLICLWIKNKIFQVKKVSVCRHTSKITTSFVWKRSSELHRLSPHTSPTPTWPPPGDRKGINKGESHDKFVQLNKSEAHLL